MLTSVLPWFGKSIEELYQSVVVKQEKPQIPSGLHPALESVISGCFEYDLHNRPLMEDILSVFQSSQNTVYSDGGWTGLERKAIAKKPSDGGYISWHLYKDYLQVGDTVKVNGMQHPHPLRVRESTLERVTFGFAAGDWHDGNETLWMNSCSELQKAKAYYVGQFVRLKENVVTPRFKRGGEWTVGRITQILPNGCLVVNFPGRLVLGDESNIFLADPAEVERVGFDTCP
ncbi:hypothetical protein OROHE_019684 [Orobanche hederae]